MPSSARLCQLRISAFALLQHLGQLVEGDVHLEQVLTNLNFLDPDNPRHLMRRLRRLFLRARPDQNEINILRGILTAVERDRGGDQ